MLSRTYVVWRTVWISRRSKAARWDTPPDKVRDAMRMEDDIGYNSYCSNKPHTGCWRILKIQVFLFQCKTTSDASQPYKHHSAVTVPEITGGFRQVRVTRIRRYIFRIFFEPTGFFGFYQVFSFFIIKYSNVKIEYFLLLNVQMLNITPLNIRHRSVSELGLLWSPEITGGFGRVHTDSGGFG